MTTAGPSPGLRHRSQASSAPKIDPKSDAQVVADVPSEKSPKTAGLSASFLFRRALFFAVVVAVVAGCFAGGYVSGARKEKLECENDIEDDDDSVNIPEDTPRYTDPQDPHNGDMDLLIRNANRSQPILQYIDNAMPEDEFATLQRCMIGHPMRTGNANHGDTFKGTKGFVLSFNEEGIKKLETEDLFKCMTSFFHRHRLPIANAWVLNMVWADVTDYNRKFAIERHTDNALVLDYPGDGEEYIMPFQTSVLYVSVPTNMVGGEIEAYPYNSDWDLMVEGVIKPSGSVKPVENRMSYFPGDAWHQVMAYSAPTNDKLRASLVLESYHVPPNILRYVKTWVLKETDKDDQDMM